MRQGDMRSLRVQEVSTSRGMITDRSGRPLAVSVPVKAIWADPKEVHDAGGISVGDRWKALYCAKYPARSALRPYQRQPERAFYLSGARVNPDMADYIKNSNCRGFICVKNHAATTRQEK